MIAVQLPGLLMKKPSIPLGLVFSQSGPYAMMAGEMRKSALMAVHEINESNAFDFVFAPHLRHPGRLVAGYHTACALLIHSLPRPPILPHHTPPSPPPTP